MCTITATEFKTNFGKYLEIALKEDILITKNGHPLFTLSKIKTDSWHDFANNWHDVKRYDIDESDSRIEQILKK